jgi:hypothetical protein
VTDIDLAALPLSELLNLHARIQREFGRRGVSRTSGPIQGEVGEGLALSVYGGTLPPPGTRAHDLIDAEGRLIQVKTRTLPPGVTRMFQFDSLDFDLAVCMRFDRETNALDWAREYDVEELRSLVSPHADGPRLPMGRATANGRDVTATFRAAYEALRGIGIE